MGRYVPVCLDMYPHHQELRGLIFVTLHVVPKSAETPFDYHNEMLETGWREMPVTNVVATPLTLTVTGRYDNDRMKQKLVGPTIRTNG